jgi:hypothetical protein
VFSYIYIGYIDWLNIGGLSLTSSKSSWKSILLIDWSDKIVHWTIKRNGFGLLFDVQYS